MTSPNSSFDIASRIDPAVQGVAAKIRSLPATIRLPIIVPSLALAVYWFWQGSGPWAWASEFFSDAHGKVLLVLPVAAVLVTALVPAIALLLVIHAARGKRGTGVNELR
jgi:hypothetical protein